MSLHCSAKCAAALLLGTITAASAPKPNILFIAVDDLRPSIGCYGDGHAITPNLDRLARRGVRFGQAHCQVAVCNPSRASLMTGQRPDTLGVWTLPIHFREAKPNAVTLPQWLRRHGYATADTVQGLLDRLRLGAVDGPELCRAPVPVALTVGMCTEVTCTGMLPDDAVDLFVEVDPDGLEEEGWEGNNFATLRMVSCETVE